MFFLAAVHAHGPLNGIHPLADVVHEPLQADRGVMERLAVIFDPFGPVLVLFAGHFGELVEDIDFVHELLLVVPEFSLLQVLSQKARESSRFLSDRKSTLVCSFKSCTFLFISATHSSIS